MVRFKLEDTLIKVTLMAKDLKSGGVAMEYMYIVAICKTAKFKVLVFINGQMVDII